MKLELLAGALAAMMLFTSAAAAPFYLVHLSKDGEDAIFLDLGSVRQVGQHKRAWTYQLQRSDKAQDGAPSVWLGQQEFDCSSWRSRVTQSLIYDLQGKLRKTSTQARPWIEVPPSTALDVQASVVCEGVSKEDDRYYDVQVDGLSFSQMLLNILQAPSVRTVD